MASNIPRELGESDAAGIREMYSGGWKWLDRKQIHTKKSVFRVLGESGPEKAVEVANASFFRHRVKEGKEHLLHVADGHIGQLSFTGFPVIGRKTTRRITGYKYLVSISEMDPDQVIPWPEVQAGEKGMKP